MKPHTAVVDLGLRGVDPDKPSVEINHHGKFERQSTNAAQVAAKAFSRGASDRIPKGGSRNATLLVKGRDGRRAVCRAMRRGFQHTLADAGHRGPEHEAFVATFLRLIFPLQYLPPNAIRLLEDIH